MRRSSCRRPGWCHWAHRGRGIRSLLLEALIEAARAQRNPALSLSVEPDNPARRLYERYGFQVIGTVVRLAHAAAAPLRMLLRA